MATRAQIRDDIKHTRDHISFTIDEIADTIHKKTDIIEKIKESPIGALTIALALGFTISTFASPLGKTIFKMASGSAKAAIFGYLTKKSVGVLKKKLKV